MGLRKIVGETGFTDLRSEGQTREENTTKKGGEIKGLIYIKDGEILLDFNNPCEICGLCNGNKKDCWIPCG